MKQKAVLYALLIVGVLILLTPLRLLSYFLLIFGSAAILPTYKRSGYITRVVIYFLIITCIHQVIGLVFWKLNIRYTYTWALLPLYAMLAAVIILKMTTITIGLRSFSCRRQEFIAAFFSIFFVSIIGVSTFSGGSIAQQSIRYISRGFDNSTHLSMVMSNYREQSYVYGDNTKGKIVQGFSGYPQGWHLSNSVIWHSIPTRLNTANISKLLFTYVITTLFWYGILLFLTTQLIINLAIKLLRRPLSYLEYFAVFGAMVIIQLVVLVGLLASGFSNYIALLAYVMASLTLLLDFSKGNIRDSTYILLTSLLAAGMSLTWLLAAPIGYILVAAPFLQKGSRIKDIPLFIKHNKLISLGVATLLTSGIVQCVIQIKYGGGVNHVNASGGSWPINQYVMSGLFGIFIWVILSRRIPSIVVDFTKIAFVSGALIVGLVYFYQYHTTAVINYYSEKITLSLMLIMLVISSAVFVYSIQYITQKSSKLLSVLLTTTLLLTIPVVLHIDTSVSRYAFGHRELSLYSSSQIADILYKQQGFHNNVIILKGLDQFEDVSTTHAIDVLTDNLVPDKCSLGLNNALFLGKLDLRIQAVTLCAKLHKDRTFYVISSSKTYDVLINEFSQTPNVSVIPSN